MSEYMHKLQGIIFQGLPKKTRHHWSERFFTASPVGLSKNNYDEKIKIPFLLIVLDNALGSFDHEKSPKVKQFIVDVISLYKSGEKDLKKFKELYTYAHASADDYAYAVALRAYVAAYIDAFAAYAAGSVYTSAYVADAVYTVAASDAVYAAVGAYADDEDKMQYFADELIKLMEDA